MRPEDSQTWNEIFAQPRIWAEWGPILANQARDISDWIREKQITEIIFAGAGTSAFIGDTLSFAKTSGLLIKAIPTTDIVACPFECLRDDPQLLVVQFGRSGDSSESIGTLDLLDRQFPKVQRLNITCNPTGALATRQPAGAGEQKVIALPEATHDSGFAMTSSFTTMLLSALACIDEQADVAGNLGTIADKASVLLPALQAMTPARPERVVFLGSGALKGVARESALKVLELTAGRTMTSWDSTLGFRHGPKAVITGRDLIVVMIHPDAHTALYDWDVAREIKAQYPDATVLTLGGEGCDVDLRTLGEARWEAPLYILAAQIWAVAWSGELALNIDNPFAGQGNLSRVVSGVTLYPVRA
ncbi:SIS domain-containing protein [Neorhizobium sp. JUb45]|uniref:SIS domain-containing protein n=1 Tax=unclassified Neorhizobium TaxID=2629175 RepID=UPI0010EED901|nr:SIS domain-containing protein [Neorhizobium sp. JUb45]TCQ96362.1 galactosamine 6-phosphate isomerase AgaS [Neorhizobium sp. JUb45]